MPAAKKASKTPKRKPGRPARAIPPEVVTLYVEGASPTVLAKTYGIPIHTLIKKLRPYMPARYMVRVAKLQGEADDLPIATPRDAVDRLRRIHHKIMGRIEAILDDPSAKLNHEVLESFHRTSADIAAVELACMEQDRLEKIDAERQLALGDGHTPHSGGDEVIVTDYRTADPEPD